MDGILYPEIEAADLGDESTSLGLCHEVSGCSSTPVAISGASTGIMIDPKWKPPQRTSCFGRKDIELSQEPLDYKYHRSCSHFNVHLDPVFIASSLIIH